MKMLTGLLAADRGHRLLFGKEVKGGDIESRRRVGFMSQAFSLYTELTVRQNLMLHARLFDLPPERGQARVEELLHEIRTARPWPTRCAESMPLGIRQRLSLAVAVLHEPEVLILDEPTSGVDPVARDGFWELLIRLSRDEGVTIFLSTHFMNEAERCDRMSMMHRGKVLAQGPPAELVGERKAPTSRRRSSAISRTRPKKPKEAVDRSGRRGTAAQPARRTAARRNSKPASEPGKFSLCASLGLRPARSHRASARHRAPGVRGARTAAADDRLRLRHLARRQSPDVRGAGLRPDAGQPSLRRQLSEARSTTTRKPIPNYAELDRRLRNGELRFAIEIPSGFEQRPDPRTPADGRGLCRRGGAVPRRDRPRLRRGDARPVRSAAARRRRASRLPPSRSTSRRARSTTSRSRASTPWCRATSCCC